MQKLSKIFVNESKNPSHAKFKFNVYKFYNLKLFIGI